MDFSILAQTADSVVTAPPAPLLKVATILIAGIVGGEIIAKVKLPKVTGWIGTGILLRMLSLPAVAAFLHSNLPEPVANFLTTLLDGFVAKPETHQYFAPIANLVLSYITFTVGAALYLPNLRNAFKRIGLLLCFEAILTPLVVAATLYFGSRLIGTPVSMMIAMLLAAIAIAGAPGTIVLVVQEARASGLLSRTLIVAVCLIDMVAVGVFVFVNSCVCADIESAEIWTAILMVLKEFGFSFLIGTLCAVISKFLIRTIVSPTSVGPVMVAVILAAWGGAAICGVNEILSAAFAGIMVSNLQHDNVRSAESYLSSIGGVLFAIFFTFAGMKLDFTKVPTVAGLVALFFFARLIGKVLSSYISMSIAGVTDRVRNYLGLALLPHGGVAVGLIILIGAQNRFDAETIDTITTVGLSALAINQLLGPSVTRFCLGRAGEDHKDRPRLLDFLQEQTIEVDLPQASKPEIVESLTSLLYSTSKQPISKEEFVARVLQHEHEETTCLGDGLMILHCIIEESEQETEVTGVIGLSSKGIDLGAPDGPIHAVLLLATPEHDRKRHLEVLDAFATAITRDVNFREQLYHARSAAHAYDVIHHEDSEDLNYFLEDAIERAGIRDGS